jgi:DNA-binding response OmpR family regulator
MLKADDPESTKAKTDAPAGGLVLVADDDDHIVELVSMYLQRSGYRVEAAHDGSQALSKARDLKPDLLVLDIMMPGEDGLQVCRSLARRGGVPIIFLTARSSDIDKIAGLRLGADDYVTKPFNPNELVARVDAVMRRAGNRQAAANRETIHVGGLAIDTASRTADRRGQRLTLTPKEFDLLATMAGFAGVVLHRDQVLDLVWGTSFYAARTVDVHVARLREKLKGSGVRIETVWGTGYRLVEE